MDQINEDSALTPRGNKNQTCSKVSEATKMAKILHKKFSQILLNSVMRAW